jgi:hypothetical protein
MANAFVKFQFKIIGWEKTNLKIAPFSESELFPEREVQSKNKGTFIIATF